MVEWKGEEAGVSIDVRRAALRDGVKDQKSRSLSGPDRDQDLQSLKH
jgi:hypothetical protein